eukprot:3177659-Rhodomonas_salina.1
MKTHEKKLTAAAERRRKLQSEAYISDERMTRRGEQKGKGLGEGRGMIRVKGWKGKQLREGSRYALGEHEHPTCAGDG